MYKNESLEFAALKRTDCRKSLFLAYDNFFNVSKFQMTNYSNLLIFLF